MAKARRRPEEVRKVLDSASRIGTVATYRKVMTKLDSYTPLGYSLCGVVVAVGPGAEEFSQGDLVACAGNDYALHAELNWVPVNLCVPVPVGVDPRHGCFATVGAIALHGVRRGEVQLGEAACVIGLGLVGQLVVRLLVASGVRVVGIDPVEYRRALAVEAGALGCAAPGPDGLADLEQLLHAMTGGLGADHVFLAAGGATNDPVQAAARLARDRARVVDIGKTSLDLPWNQYYDKELDLRLSRSYGPGRYDERYEIDGIDYPPGYVRWTERRNLACFLDLLARGHVDVEPLVSEVFPIEEAAEVYDRLAAGRLRGVGFLFSYPKVVTGGASPTVAPTTFVGDSRSPRRAVPHGEGRPVRLGFIGAGNYASSMLLPHLGPDSGAELVHVATATPLSAANAQRRFGFARASTDPSAMLEDDSIDAVFVVTRHSSHAELVCRALEAGKAVFVEKPLALTPEQLGRGTRRGGPDRERPGHGGLQPPLRAPVWSGCGRRSGGRGPATVLRYLVNAGPLDTGQLVPGCSEGGNPVLRRRGSLRRHRVLVARRSPTGAGPRLRGSGRRRHGGRRGVRRRVRRLHRLRHRRQPAVSRRRPSTFPPAGERPGSRISGGPPCGPAAAGGRSGVPAPSTRARRARCGRSSPPSRPGRRCRSASTPWPTPPGPRWRSPPAWLRVNRSECDPTATVRPGSTPRGRRLLGTGSRFGWYWRRSRHMSAGELSGASPRPGAPAAVGGVAGTTG